MGLGKRPSATTNMGGASPTDATATPSPPNDLITLERPFDLDEFGRMLGEPSLRVTVPREDLPEVLRRVTDFMGFGIYVYAIRVRPAPEEALTKFLVELERVDYSPHRHDWVTFEETGRADSPFGPGSKR